MALTVGIDSYVTLSEANAYFDNRMYADEWIGASDPEKEKALKMAARTMARFNWAGSITSDDQILSWPRQNMIDAEGRVIASNAIPQVIKDAQCEVALGMLRDDLTADDGNKSVRRLKAGSVEIEYAGQAPAAARAPDIAMDMVKPFLKQASGATARMVF